MLGIIDNCKKTQEQIELYLDNELEGQEQLEVQEHLQACVSCNQVYKEMKALLSQVSQAKPLYPVPKSLRKSIENLLNDVPESYQASPELHNKVIAILERKPTKSSIFPYKKVVAAIAATIIIFFTTAVYWLSNNVPVISNQSNFALMAVDSHLRHQRGQLPLEINSSSAEEISKWFANKLSFNLKLPNYQEVSGQEKLYQLEGARLVGFKDDYAAHVSYKMQNRPITLVVTSSFVATPSGGEKIISKGLVFYYSVIKDLKVISWTDRGLTYALISDLAERGQQSCIVCHSGTEDKDFIDDLKIKF
jgi:anti-sigma factor RsiW